MGPLEWQSWDKWHISVFYDDLHMPGFLKSAVKWITAWQVHKDIGKRKILGFGSKISNGNSEHVGKCKTHQHSVPVGSGNSGLPLKLAESHHHLPGCVLTLDLRAQEQSTNVPLCGKSAHSRNRGTIHWDGGKWLQQRRESIMQLTQFQINQVILKHL